MLKANSQILKYSYLIFEHEFFYDEACYIPHKVHVIFISFKAQVLTQKTS